MQVASHTTATEIGFLEEADLPGRAKSHLYGSTNSNSGVTSLSRRYRLSASEAPVRFGPHVGLERTSASRYSGRRIVRFTALPNLA